MNLETVDIPRGAKGRPGLYDWDEIAKELRELPDGKAKVIPMIGSTIKCFQSACYSALRRRGNFHTAIRDGNLLVWERR